MATNTRGNSSSSKSTDYSDRELLDEIKSRVSLGMVAGSYASRIHCPVCCSDGRDLSLQHNLNRFKCYHGTCGLWGKDIFDWEQKVNGLTFTEAKTKLADIAGIELKKGDNPQTALLAKVMKQYRENLEHNETAQAFLLSRGIRKETWFMANIGWAAGYPTDALKPRELLDCRLLWPETHNPYFQDRLIFAWHGLRGEIVTLQGRNLTGEEPKYLTLTAERRYGTFPITDYLYGHEFLRQMGVGEDAYLLEGCPDTLIVRQYGLNAFGIAGNERFAHHAPRLKGARRLFAIFDNDPASREKALPRLLSMQTNMPDTVVYDVVLPKPADQRKQDVNSWYLDNGQPDVEVFQAMVEANATPVVEAAIQRWGADVSQHERLIDAFASHDYANHWMEQLADVSKRPLVAIQYLYDVRRQ